MEFARGKDRKLVLEVLRNILEGRIDVCPYFDSRSLVFFTDIVYYLGFSFSPSVLVFFFFFSFVVKTQSRTYTLLEHIW